jgi:hypothetical protein
MEESLCDPMGSLLGIRFDDDHELRMEELFREFLMIEMKSLRLPSFFRALIEDILVESEDELESEHRHSPPGREKKWESLRLKWLQ